MGVWTIHVQPFRDQNQAVLLVKKCNGSIQTQTAVGSAWQRWLVVRMLGEDQFVHVQRVDLRNTNPDGETLESLRQLRFVRHLYLDRTAMDDNILKRMASLTELRVLSLSYTQISDKGIENLHRLKLLEKLYLTSTKVSDRSLETLLALDSLQQLFLRWTEVTDPGIERLRNELPDCQVHYHRFNVDSRSTDSSSNKKSDSATGVP